MLSINSYEFNIYNYESDKAFNTKVLPPQRKFLSPIDEAVAAVKLLNEKYKKFVLILQPDFESAATFESFYKAHVDFSVAQLKIKSNKITNSSSWLKSICLDYQINYQEIEFDPSNKVNQDELLHISDQLNCLNIRVLLNLWVCCQFEEAPVLPGSFTIPTKKIKNNLNLIYQGPLKKNILSFFLNLMVNLFFLVPRLN